MMKLQFPEMLAIYAAVISTLLAGLRVIEFARSGPRLSMSIALDIEKRDRPILYVYVTNTGGKKISLRSVQIETVIQRYFGIRRRVVKSVHFNEKAAWQWEVMLEPGASESHGFLLFEDWDPEKVPFEAIRVTIFDTVSAKGTSKIFGKKLVDEALRRTS